MHTSHSVCKSRSACIFLPKYMLFKLYKIMCLVYKICSVLTCTIKWKTKNIFMIFDSTFVACSCFIQCFKTMAFSFLYRLLLYLTTFRSCYIHVHRDELGKKYICWFNSSDRPEFNPPPPPPARHKRSVYNA